jgi:hypothetical protein
MTTTYTELVEALRWMLIRQEPGTDLDAVRQMLATLMLE